MTAESKKVTQVIYSQIVTPNRTGFGAFLCDIFFELQNSQESLKMIGYFMGKKYEGRELVCVCIPVESYVGYYMNILRNEY